MSPIMCIEVDQGVSTAELYNIEGALLNIVKNVHLATSTKYLLTLEHII